MGVVEPPESLFKSTMIGNIVNSPQEGIVVVEPEQKVILVEKDDDLLVQESEHVLEQLFPVVEEQLNGDRDLLDTESSQKKLRKKKDGFKVDASS
jgi:hypothetical protein